MSPAVASEMMFEQSLKLVLDFSSHFKTALHAVILKSCKYLFEQSTNIAIPIYHFRVVEIHFCIENPCQSSNLVNKHYKLESHSKQNKSVADILIRMFHDE